MTDQTGKPRTRRECLDWLQTNGVDEIDALTVYRLIGFAIDADLTVTLNDGEEDVIVKSTDRPALVWAMVSTDADVLRFYSADGKKAGFAYLVYGNDPGEIISDHTDNETVARLVAQAEDHEARRALDA